MFFEFFIPPNVPILLLKFLFPFNICDELIFKLSSSISVLPLLCCFSSVGGGYHFYGPRFADSLAICSPQHLYYVAVGCNPRSDSSSSHFMSGCLLSISLRLSRAVRPSLSNLFHCLFSKSCTCHLLSCYE